MTARLARRGPDRRRNRTGFTLIELMIVVVIIAILIGLLVPAVNGAVRNAREARVKTEIGQLDYAISDFKANFGIVPPSYIDFRLKDGGGTGALNPTGGSLPPKTQSTLRRLWPNIDISGFTAELQKSANHPSQRELDGSACLLFFLGGVVPGAGEAPVGFASNPRTPIPLSAAPSGTKRIGPFFEFRVDRLYDKDPTPFNGYEGYLDSLPGQTMPYFYVTSDRYATQETTTALPATSVADKRPVYRQSASSFFNAQSFQIISPGPDGATGEFNSQPGGAYGIGGILDESQGDGVLKDPAAPTDATKNRQYGDLDNITNFHEGRLIK